MKAIVHRRYGSPDVLEFENVEQPVPKDNELLIRVHASSVGAAESFMRRGEPLVGRLILGLSKPKKIFLGSEFSGEVETVGKDVRLFKAGEAVFGSTDTLCGAYAEYVSLPEDGVLVSKPANLTHEEAAPTCDGALTALNFLRDVGGIQKGHKVLINGASGGVGTSAVQLAKYFGAEVTGVCSTANLELVKSLGADRVIDYSREDFTEGGPIYDIIFDTVGKTTFSSCKSSLAENGVYMSPALGLPILFQMLWTSKIGSKKAKFSATGLRPVPDRRAMLSELKELFEAGKLKTVIDRRYPLEETAEAHRYVDGGHKKGNVVITV
jgi:NADPH:quinone reductase-like Zn-dependent oxidoreductase